MPGLIIQEVYASGGTGNAGGSTYKSDYVVLYNSGPTALSLNGYALQVRQGPNNQPLSPFSLNQWTKADIPAGYTVQPYSYFLIKLGPEGGNGVSLSNVDLDLNSVTALAIGVNNGRVALTNTTTPLTNGTTAATNPTSGGAIVDYLGYGNAASSEGNSPATAATVVTQSMQRVADASSDSWDTNVNGTDFKALAVNPHYSGSTALNYAPAISNASPAVSIAENTSSATTILDLTAFDAEGQTENGGGLKYELISSADSSKFSFDTATGVLKFVASPDYETQTSYSLTFKVTDSNDNAGLSAGLIGSATKAFTINVTPVDEYDATDVNLSSSTIVENNPGGAMVAMLSAADLDAGETYAFELVAGAGDNSAFSISGNQLTITGAADYETQQSYSVVIKASSGAKSFQFTKTIGVLNVNEFAPTAIILSADHLDEGNVNPATVATLSATDGDYGETFTYSFVNDASGADNASFSISGSKLVLNESADFETKPGYTIHLQVTDSGGKSYDEVRTITVNDVNEFAPNAINLSQTSITENNASGVTVATLSATDPDIVETFTYALVSGTGDADNGRFAIGGTNGDELILNESADYEALQSYSIRLQVTDSKGLMFESEKTIPVGNQNEFTPTPVGLSATTLNENNAVNATVATLLATDGDFGDTVTYSLFDSTGDTANASFSISGNKLVINASADFETTSQYLVRIKATDSGGLFSLTDATIAVNDVDEAPSSVSISNPLSALPEGTSTVSPIKLGDITITDDKLGTNTATLSGADSGFFEILGNALYLKAGTILDFETKPGYSVTVDVDGAGTGSAVDASTAFTLNVGDVSPELLIGTPDDDNLVTGLGSDEIIGLAGDDTLDGGAGDDIMRGGFGNDTYYVNSKADKTIELAGQGLDTVVTSVDWTLGANIENLELARLPTNTSFMRAVGNALANTITGSDGRDLINGWTGNDILEGGGGDDTLNGYKGSDTASYEHAASAVTVRLGINAVQDTIGAGKDYLVSIEHLTGSKLDDHLTGSKGNNILQGLDGADQLFGGAGNDRLFGGDGNDRLSGGSGRDSLDGGAGADTFIFNSIAKTENLDTISGFVSGTDKIELENAVYKALVMTGGLDAGSFVSGAGAHALDANDHVIYDTSTGSLYYDSNGSGAGGLVRIAILSGHPALDAADIFIV